MLLVSRIHIKDVHPRYELSRWLLAIAMIILAIHYVLQMIFGFREQGDDAGAVINILFYAPVSMLISYTLINIACGGRYRRRFLWICIGYYLAIFISFTIGLVSYHSLHMKHALYLMAALYFLSNITCGLSSIRELTLARNRLESVTGGDLSTFDYAIRADTIIMYCLAAMTVLMIFFRTLLGIIGPLMLLSIIFYVVSFVCLGFSMAPMKEVLESNEEDFSPCVPDKQQQTVVEASTAGASAKDIKSALEKWIEEHNYRDSSTSLASLSRQISVSQPELSRHILQNHGITFRVWLSKIRLEEAKRLLLEFPNYSNEVIASECGFTSRNYFQNIFKEETGYTPKEWKKNKLGDSTE